MASPSSRSILNLHELVETIYSYLDVCSRSRLARSNHQLFRAFMPLLWEHVEGLAQLLNLSPALLSICEDGGKDPIAASDIRQYLSTMKPLKESDLVRFDVYAPWVKHLEIHKSGSLPKYEKVLGMLLDHSSTHTLLPNLESLNCTVYERSHTRPISVLPFLSSTLTSLQFINAIAFYERTNLLVDTKILLYTLSIKCPQLKTLALIPQCFVSKKTTVPRCSLVEELTRLVDPEIHKVLRNDLGWFISGMPPLVSLTVPADVLGADGFEVISTWPLLESVEVLQELDTSLPELPHLPDTAFPALKHLGFHQVFDLLEFEMFWDVPMLVNRLTSAGLTLSGEFSDLDEEILDDIISVFVCLAIRSPCVRYLWLDIKDPHDVYPVYKCPVATISELKPLPLQKLHLGGLAFENSVDLPQYLVAAFPGLIELGLPNHSITLADLQVFRSELPYLEVLRVQFQLDTLWSSPVVDLSTVTRYRKLPLHTLEGNFLGDTEEEIRSDISSLECPGAEALSKYLFSLWPNVQLAPRGETQHMKIYEKHMKLIALINDHLAGLSYCNCDPSIGYDSIMLLNEASWEKCKEWSPCSHMNDSE